MSRKMSDEELARLPEKTRRATLDQRRVRQRRAARESTAAAYTSAAAPIAPVGPPPPGIRPGSAEAIIYAETRKKLLDNGLWNELAGLQMLVTYSKCAVTINNTEADEVPASVWAAFFRAAKELRLKDLPADKPQLAAAGDRFGGAW